MRTPPLLKRRDMRQDGLAPRFCGHRCCLELIQRVQDLFGDRWKAYSR
jgi:hypothetical protein